MSWRDAQAAGCLFKSDPTALPDDVDAAIRPILERINSSGWVWTGESCAGHFDDSCGWKMEGERNDKRPATDPFVRLVFHQEYLCEVARNLLHAHESVLAERGAVCGPIRLMPRRVGAWFELRVYVGASNSSERDAGLDVLKRFAESL